MTQIAIDATLASRLHAVAEPVDLCDPSGQVLGTFVPKKIDMTGWEPISPEVSEEELDRREKSDEWYSTEEVLAHLRSLEDK